METNKPEVISHMAISADKFPEKCRADDPHGFPVIRLSDYERLQAECDALRAKTSLSLGVGDGTGNLFVHGDYDSIKRVQELVFECEQLRTALDAHKAARIAYASEFPLGADGTPDVGSIHENIRLLKKDAEFGRSVLDKQCREAVASALGFARGGDYAWSYLLQQIKDITSAERKQPGLTEALRQYQHNDGSGLVFGYDRLLVDQYVAGLVEALERIVAWPDGGNKYGQANIKIFAAEALVAYREGGE